MYITYNSKHFRKIHPGLARPGWQSRPAVQVEPDDALAALERALVLLPVPFEAVGELVEHARDAAVQKAIAAFATAGFGNRPGSDGALEDAGAVAARRALVTSAWLYEEARLLVCHIKQFAEHFLRGAPNDGALRLCGLEVLRSNLSCDRT